MLFINNEKLQFKQNTTEVTGLALLKFLLHSKTVIIELIV